jgi:hypothetical protein
LVFWWQELGAGRRAQGAGLIERFHAKSATKNHAKPRKEKIICVHLFNLRKPTGGSSAKLICVQKKFSQRTQRKPLSTNSPFESLLQGSAKLTGLGGGFQEAEPREKRQEVGGSGSMQKKSRRERNESPTANCQKPLMQLFVSPEARPPKSNPGSPGKLCTRGGGPGCEEAKKVSSKK